MDSNSTRRLQVLSNVFTEDSEKRIQLPPITGEFNDIQIKEETEYLADTKRSDDFRIQNNQEAYAESDSDSDSSSFFSDNILEDKDLWKNHNAIPKEKESGSLDESVDIYPGLFFDDNPKFLFGSLFHLEKLEDLVENSFFEEPMDWEDLEYLFRLSEPQSGQRQDYRSFDACEINQQDLSLMSLDGLLKKQLGSQLIKDHLDNRGFPTLKMKSTCSGRFESKATKEDLLGEEPSLSLTPSFF